MTPDLVSEQTLAKPRARLTGGPVGALEAAGSCADREPGWEGLASRLILAEQTLATVGAQLEQVKTHLLEVKESLDRGELGARAGSREATAARWLDLLDKTRLTEREVEVLRLIAAGKSNQEIAEALVISRHTVIRHVSNIFAKSGAANRAEAAAFGAKHGLA